MLYPAAGAPAMIPHIATDLAAAAEEDLTAAVETLVRRYQAPLFGYLYHLLGEREWAEEVTQDTFLRAFQARGRLPEIANRRAWLYRIATNLAHDAWKRRHRFDWLPWHEVDGLGVSEPDVAEQAERRSALAQALAALPFDCRAPLLLRLHHGLSLVEVAQALGISEGAASKRLYRARERFRRAYACEQACEQASGQKGAA